MLDVLDSENELFQARQDYVNADYDELFSEFRLFNAKGELMRAFRIYRPQLLGFNDEFDKKKIIPKAGPTAIDELKEDEKTLRKTPSTPPSSAEKSNKAPEDELFLEADENTGSW